MSEWSPKQYLKFGNDRTQPAIDLVNRINVENPKKILDVGSGPGNSTKVLYDFFPNAKIIGIDNSLSMVEKAKEKYPNLEFMICDANKDLSKLDRDFDIVFSNACIQWIPNHKKLLKEMMSLLNVGGMLAIQIPMNGEAELYKIIANVVDNPKWGFNNVELEHNEILKPYEYFDILASISSDFSMWETMYYQRMKSHQDLVEWVKSTKIRPYLNYLDDEKKIVFENEILEQVKQKYMIQENGEIIFEFRRLFFIATK